MRMRLADLIRLLLQETDVRRLRLSSVEPMDWSDDLLRLLADSPRIAKHVHAPLQSGSDTVLKRMKRRYRVRHYADRLTRARALMPGAAIGADGLRIEVHPCPEKAFSDGAQSLDLREFRAMMDDLRPYVRLWKEMRQAVVAAAV